MEMKIMNLILHSGNARSFAMQAMQAAREGEFTQADELLEQSANELLEAHRSQTELIQGEARGEVTNISMLLIHAQDHLMTAMTLKDLAIEIVDLRKKQ
ncbi:MAG: PTS lactose/cellobiose transporter subunit IIA [Bacillaceae bacterium]